MPQFTRKHKAVEAMQLSEDNLDKVEQWSEGEIIARRTKKYPPIVLGKKTGNTGHYTDIRYANFGWWLLRSVEGFEVMSHEHFARDYQAI